MQKVIIDDPNKLIERVYDLIVYREGKKDEVKVRTFFDCPMCKIFPAYLKYEDRKNDYQQIESLDARIGLLHQVIAVNELGGETLEKILECQKEYYSGILACLQTGVVDFGFYSHSEIETALRDYRKAAHRITKGIQRAKENKIKFWEPVEFAEDSKRSLTERPKVKFLPHTKKIYEAYRVFTDRMREQRYLFLTTLKKSTLAGADEMRELFNKESALKYYLNKFCKELYPEGRIKESQNPIELERRKPDLKLMELMIYSISKSDPHNRFANLVNFFTPNWDFNYILENIKKKDFGREIMQNAEFQDLLKGKSCNIRVFTRTGTIEEGNLPRFVPTGRLILKHRGNESYFFIESLPTREGDRIEG